MIRCPTVGLMQLNIKLKNIQKNQKRKHINNHTWWSKETDKYDKYDEWHTFQKTNTLVTEKHKKISLLEIIEDCVDVWHLQLFFLRFHAAFPWIRGKMGLVNIMPWNHVNHLTCKKGRNWNNDSTIFRSYLHCYIIVVLLYQMVPEAIEKNISF